MSREAQKENHPDTQRLSYRNVGTSGVPLAIPPGRRADGDMQSSRGTVWHQKPHTRQGPQLKLDPICFPDARCRTVAPTRGANILCPHQHRLARRLLGYSERPLNKGVAVAQVDGVEGREHWCPPLLVPAKSCRGNNSLGAAMDHRSNPKERANCNSLSRAFPRTQVGSLCRHPTLRR